MRSALLVLVGVAIGITAMPSARAMAHDSIAYRKHVVREVFGPAGDAAIRVALCESGLNPWAHNGQYLGAFQMGAGERRRFGHGRGLWAQARAAHRYFALSGWSPWECQP